MTFLLHLFTKNIVYRCYMNESNIEMKNQQLSLLMKQITSKKKIVGEGIIPKEPGCSGKFKNTK